MMRLIKLNAVKKETLFIGGALLFCFLVHFLLIKQGINWYCVDIEGYLSHAATFSGRDWSGVLRNAQGFYAWGYSVLLTIPMVLTGNVTAVYYTAVFCNALLCCGILLICYKIAKEIAPNVEHPVLIFCSAAVSVYSSYVFQGTVMFAEIYLYFFVFATILCLLKYIRTEKAVWGILSGLCAGYTYAIHNRSIGLVIAYALVAVVWCMKSKDWKKALVMLLPLAVMMGVNHKVVQYLNACEKQGEVYTVNTYASHATALSTGSFFYKIISIMKSVLGECWYALIGSFGMMGVGVYSAVKKIYEAWKTKSDDSVWYAFLILMLLGTLAVSVLGIMPKVPMDETGRYDLYIYGRYWEMTFGIFILLGFLECYNKITKNVLINIIFGCIFLSAVIEYMTKAYQGNMNGHWWSIPAVLTTFFYPQKEFTVLASSVVGIAFMIWIFYMFTQHKKALWAGAVSVWTLFNIFTGYIAIFNVTGIYWTYKVVLAVPFFNENFNDVCNYLEENDVDEFAVCSGLNDYSVVFQLAFPDNKIESVLPGANMPDMEICIFEKNTWTEEYIGIVCYENDDYYVMNVSGQ